MIESIAQASMAMSAAEFATEYATSVTKMSMENQEALAANLINQMMPTPPPMQMGDFIDTYA